MFLNAKIISVLDAHGFTKGLIEPATNPAMRNVIADCPPNNNEQQNSDQARAAINALEAQDVCVCNFEVAEHNGVQIMRAMIYA